MIKYKLTTQDVKTYNGFQWEIGKTERIEETLHDNRLCSPDVFHFYDHPALAIIFNPVHANIGNPRLWKVAVKNIVAHDGTKGGCKEMMLLRKVALPKITLEQKVEFAIRCALLVYKNPAFRVWAKDWLSGKDRTDAAAYAAARAAADAAAAAAAAADAAAAAALNGKGKMFVKIINKILDEGDKC